MDYQEKYNLHTATKIRRRHIDFQREKMKVKLAALIEKLYPQDFAGVEATSIFCRKINNIFDFLNSRRKFGKHDSEKCVAIENLKEMEEKAEEYIDYIKSLKIFDSLQSSIAISILHSKRKTGFLGLIIALKSTLKLARYVFEKQLMS